MNEALGEAIGSEVPSRAREKFFEGDLRTAWVGKESLGPETELTANLWGTLPQSVRDEIAEVLELYIMRNQPTNSLFEVVLDGVIIVLNGYDHARALPVHKPRFTICFQNSHATLWTCYSWGIRYRKKSPHVEGG